jgi:hypothetical protein
MIIKQNYFYPKSQYMNKYFKKLSNFKGFGNPKGKIWFVGLEEAADFNKDLDQIVKGYSKEFAPFEMGGIEEDANRMGNSYTKIYDVMSKIMVGLHPEGDWKTYRNTKLLTEESNEFQMNLYPVGKKNLASWSESIQAKLGFNSKEDYLSTTQNQRFPQLHQFWKLHDPDFTICFGIGNCDDFKKAFNLREGRYLEDSNTFLFPDDRVLITPFFNNRFMGQARIGKTIALIKEYRRYAN